MTLAIPLENDPVMSFRLRPEITDTEQQPPVLQTVYIGLPSKDTEIVNTSLTAITSEEQKASVLSIEEDGTGNLSLKQTDLTITLSALRVAWQIAKDARDTKRAQRILSTGMRIGTMATRYHGTRTSEDARQQLASYRSSIALTS